MVTKKCTKCSGEYPATTEYFYRDKQKRDRLYSWCRVCHRAAIEAYQCTNVGKADQKERCKKYRKTIPGYLHTLYGHMKQRCTNPKCHNYRNYGGRGIECKFEASDAFIAYVVDVLQVDPRGKQCHRIDSDGNYDLGNIEFLTAEEHVEKHRKLKIRG